jgi:hypothetical protein
MPDFRAFMEERALPSAERGPVEALGVFMIHDPNSKGRTQRGSVREAGPMGMRYYLIRWWHTKLGLAGVEGR